ncbi:MAG: GDP-L-fucose synthase [Bacteroidales bacterium]|nr:GDP-L-fucose synthase [Bacteroidales bacterium]MCR4858054.1 GDP-L-fucose synthase [Bacteroidales bacterium]
MEKNAKIYVAGHRGLVGSAIMRCLQNNGYQNIIVRTHKELDLRNQAQVNQFFETERPEYVFLAAAKVGGILANNTYPADFSYDNLMISANVIHAAYQYQVKKLLFLGSSCIYPKMAPQPIKEEYLLTGALEPTNEGYALAKISGMQMCKFYRRQYGCDFISAMPTNLYGINDNFDLTSSHVLPAMIRKFHEAKVQGAPNVTLWGTGKVLREFLYVDDLADALLHLMNHYSAESHVNIGTGEDLSIHELALLVKEVVGFEGDIVYDTSKPDGTPRKLLDVSLLHQIGWHHQMPLKKGIETVYEWFKQQNHE